MFSVHNSALLAVVSQKEMIDIVDRYKDIIENIVLISITTPGDNYLTTEISNKFKKCLNVQFNDLEEDFCQYKVISKETALVLASFIKDNKDEIFCVHCDAGRSRSAGVGKAIECIKFCDADMYLYNTSTIEDSIRIHSRYDFNNFVYRRVMEMYDTLN